MEGTKFWKVLSAVLLLVAVGMLIGIIVLAVHEPTVPEICSTPHCVATAGKMLQNIDSSIDPCDNFFEFACGGWMKRKVIPEDRSSYDVFAVIREELQVILKELFEREKSTDDKTAITKVKDFYSSCVDLETIDERDDEPLSNLLHDLGGWPVLGDTKGGNWNQTDYDFEALMGHLSGQYNNDVIVGSFVRVDDKDSTRYVLFIDQPSLGMKSRDYYLEEQYAHYKKAYFDYMVTIATMLGADEGAATIDMTAVLEYETLLANITIPAEERHDKEALYNPTTISGLVKAIPEIDWVQYFDTIMPDEIKPLNDTEEVINRSPDYMKNASRITIDETPQRVVANYLIWRITMNRISNLSQRFRDAQQVYYNVLRGTNSVSARWRDCVDYVNGALKMASGRMYVEDNFAGDSKQNMLKMIGNLKTAFKDMLAYNEWMDEDTKIVAREKCDAMRHQIGYPDWIMEDSTLDEFYVKMYIAEDTYFENVLDYIGWSANDNLARLRKDVDKDEWTMGPAVFNAYYSRTSNKIVFPAGILRPPFYHKDSPWYLNYGGIGVVIGHEITHGFDDQGRQYDKDGNLKQWWSDESITSFKERAQCVIDQYGQYIMPENNKTLNGIKTQSENIADNGGLKESFKAYMENEYANIKLPGFEEYTPEQLFYLNFAQDWCSVYRPEGVDSAIITAPHSPKRYRAMGPPRNSFDWPKAYNCPDDTYMNPPADDKCVIW
ncbi:membrane metallo-endopeptidase-like 1 [Amphiura filiformis]|uniref:membrane metallo-endopeptidase-like 1 n=1 Tax=Amphiura filiformis TaxID=82378 RepID=UPI003B20CF94